MIDSVWFWLAFIAVELTVMVAVFVWLDKIAYWQEQIEDIALEKIVMARYLREEVEHLDESIMGMQRILTMQTIQKLGGWKGQLLWAILIQNAARPAKPSQQSA